MKIFDYFLEHSFFFNLSQLPFTKQKFVQILKYGDLDNAKFVLDVGCGPGTNCHRFAHVKYLGIDINPRYIELARSRYQRDFLVADLTSDNTIPANPYDFILVNSFLHHIDTPSTLRILSRLSEVLSPVGYLHSVELVLPEAPGVARWLAHQDRGRYARSLSDWRKIFEDKLETVVFEPFPIRHLGQTIMELVYFKGRVKK